MHARHFPKIRGGQEPPAWLMEHTARNMHALGPTPEVLAEWKSAGLVLPDLPAMRRYRVERVREQLRAAQCDGILLYDPLNVRYATGTRNMSIHCMRTPSRFVFIPLEGPVTLFEYRTCEHLVEGIETIQQVRPAVSWNYFSSGPNREARATRWGWSPVPGSAQPVVDGLHNRNGDALPALP